MANTNLGSAKKAKQDEFYTQWADIEREINAYLEYDPNVFRGKTILLPCDDPEWSNFTKFFALHFVDFGLKKLISTSYAPESNAQGAFYAPTLFETANPVYNEEKSMINGRLFVLEGEDISGDGTINIDDLQWKYLKGDGDFRSTEVSALRDEADIVITNPPFSLFREFVSWLVAGSVRFSMIGPIGAPTTKAIFPLVMSNQLWLGRGFARGNAYFRIPEAARTEYANGVYDPNSRLVHFRNVSWYTNIEHGRRHEPLKLMTKADNIKYSKHDDVRGIGYQQYDNCDAIEVPHTDSIPSDHDGVFGVPVSFLNRYNPDQFEIVGITKTWFGFASKIYPLQTQISKDGRRSSVTKLNDGAVLSIEGPLHGKTYYEVAGQLYRQTYPRILIRKKG